MSFVPLFLTRRLQACTSTVHRMAASVSLLVSLALISGCQNADAPDPAGSVENKKARSDDRAVVNSVVGEADTASPGSVSADIVLGPGFRYDPDDRIEGNEEFVTIRLGNGLRIYYRGEWRPATLTLLDDNNNVLDSLRLDLPPVGAISGNLPDTTPPFSKVRLVFVADGLATETWERQIGVSTPELTSEMINDLNKENKNTGSNSANLAVVLASHEATLDPTFGSIHIVACDANTLEAGIASTTTYTGNLVTDHLRSEEGNLPDEAWLPRRVLNVFDELRGSSGPSRDDATE